MSNLAPKRDAGLPDIEQLNTMVREVLSLAKQRGATAAEASVSYGEGLSVSVRMGEVETLEFNRDRGMGVTVYIGQSKGSASTSDWSKAALTESVDAACSIARYTSKDEFAGLADTDILARNIPDLDLYHPWDLQAEQAIQMASACEQAARDEDKRITNSDGATVSTYQGLSVYGNSNDFIGGYAGSRHSISCAVIADDGEGMQRDYWYDVARDSNQLLSAESIGKTAAQRTVRRLNGKRLGTRNAAVLYVPELARGFIGHFSSAIRGSRLYRKSSFLLDKLDKQIFPDFANISERPHILQGLGSAPFDNEGVQTADKDIINDGILSSYILNSYSARKLGMQTTGNAGGVHNMCVEPGQYNFEELVKNMGTGLIVTELMGQGINYVTGDYSRGASGFWVEGGEIQYPVDEITIAGNLSDMFMNIQELGNDVDARGSIRCGSILVDGMTVAGE
ncbi:MAG TPA: metalloprotease PmbA [Gammaproteobacteria bacterium]|nr:metalloprotease PmbA [Gammaproteobacteria bacterium]